LSFQGVGLRKAFPLEGLRELGGCGSGALARFFGKKHGFYWQEISASSRAPLGAKGESPSSRRDGPAGRLRRRELILLLGRIALFWPWRSNYPREGLFFGEGDLAPPARAIFERGPLSKTTLIFRWRDLGKPAAFQARLGKAVSRPPRLKAARILLAKCRQSRRP
jgi:hypothetical protein